MLQVDEVAISRAPIPIDPDIPADPAFAIADVDHAFAVSEWMNGRLAGLSIPTIDVVLLPVLSLSLSLEHHRGITMLLRAGVYAPAFVLARPALEAYVRGTWLRLSATSEQLDRYKRNKLDISFGSMVAELETVAGFTDKVLSRGKESSWSVLNGFTHGGPAQTSRQISTEAIEPSATVGEVSALARHSSAVAILAFQGIVLNAGRQDLAIEAVEYIQGWAGTSTS